MRYNFGGWDSDPIGSLKGHDQVKPCRAGRAEKSFADGSSLGYRTGKLGVYRETLRYQRLVFISVLLTFRQAADRQHSVRGNCVILLVAPGEVRRSSIHYTNFPSETSAQGGSEKASYQLLLARGKDGANRGISDAKTRATLALPRRLQNCGHSRRHPIDYAGLARKTHFPYPSVWLIATVDTDGSRRKSCKVSKF